MFICAQDQHVFDQWSVSHAVWGFILGAFCVTPKQIPAWKIGLLFVFWELWENVIEVAFSTYAPGQYHGDSVINSLFDMIPSMTGVYLGRHHFNLWPVFLLADAAGGEEVRRGLHTYFRKADVVLLIFDLTNHTTFLS